MLLNAACARIVQATTNSGRNLRAFGPEVFLRSNGEFGNVNVLELKGLEKFWADCGMPNAQCPMLNAMERTS